MFADKIGVPRSGLSHVIKGRNKPSLDYVLRILKSFPEIDSNWLLTGEIKAQNEYKNTMENIAQKSSELSSKIHLKNDENTVENNANLTQGNESKILDLEDITLAKEEETAPYLKNKFIENSEKVKDKKVEKIVFFYSDGSFEEYKN